MDERLSRPEEDATFSGRQLSNELSAISDDHDRVDAILQRFGNERRSLLHIGDPESGIEFIGLGAIKNAETLADSAQTAAEHLQRYFGGRLEEGFPGLKVYFGDGIIEGGGEALPDENAIIIDATKGAMPITDVEQFLVGIGSLEPGDWTTIVDPSATYAEITVVHELGHLLEAKAHGAEGVAFNDLDHSDAPTKYGREADHKPGPNNEDYPESLVYDVYGLKIDANRQAILRRDVERVAGSAED